MRKINGATNGRGNYKHGAINGRGNYKHGAINEEEGTISNGRSIVFLPGAVLAVQERTVSFLHSLLGSDYTRQPLNVE